MLINNEFYYSHGIFINKGNDMIASIKDKYDDTLYMI